MSQSPQTVTLTLTEEETTLVETLARENGISAPADVLHLLLHDAIKVYDALCFNLPPTQSPSGTRRPARR